MFATETGLTEVDRLGGGSLGYLCQFIAARGGLDPVIPSSYAYMWYDAAECPEQSISPVPDVSGAINTPVIVSESVSKSYGQKGDIPARCTGLFKNLEVEDWNMVVIATIPVCRR